MFPAHRPCKTARHQDFLKNLKKVLDILTLLCYNVITKGEGSATREQRADPRESVRHFLKTPAARSPVVRDINVNQALRTQPQDSGRGTAGRVKPLGNPKGIFIGRRATDQNSQGAPLLLFVTALQLFCNQPTPFCNFYFVPEL